MKNIKLFPCFETFGARHRLLDLGKQVSKYEQMKWLKCNVELKSGSIFTVILFWSLCIFIVYVHPTFNMISKLTILYFSIIDILYLTYLKKEIPQLFYSNFPFPYPLSQLHCVFLNFTRKYHTLYMNPVFFAHSPILIIKSLLFYSTISRTKYITDAQFNLSLFANLSF